MNAVTAPKPAAGALTVAEQNEAIRTALKTSLYPGASDASVDLVLAYCRASGLDPMTKPVHIVPMSVTVGKDDRGYAKKETRDVVMPLYQSLDATTHVTDAKAFVGWLDAQATVDRKRKLGTMGYCMGGPITMRTAAALPERIGAAASFHGGGLVTDQPDSPHLLVPQMKAHYLIAIAENDDEREPHAKDVLRQAFAAASLPAEIEVSAGAMHGWCPPDSAVYNEAQAERAWSRLLALFVEALG